MTTTKIEQGTTTKSPKPTKDSTYLVGAVDNCPATQTNPTFRGLSGLSAESKDPADKPRRVGVEMNCQEILRNIHILDLNEASSSTYKSALNRLQESGVLPTDPLELDHALYLIDRCIGFPLSSSHSTKFVNPLLLATIKHAREKGWNALYEAYNNSKRDMNIIQDPLKDYLKSTFLPQLFRSINELGPKHLLYKLFSIEWTEYEEVRWTSNYSPLFELGALILCKDKDIAELAAFSAHWHAPLQHTVFQQFKSSYENSWPSLFQSSEDNERQESHKELEIPESVFGKKGYKFIARTSQLELVEEGKRLCHCVAGYANKCERENTHIISFVDEEGQSLSTIELSVGNNRYSIRSSQHRAYQNSTPSADAIKAHDWLVESLSNGTIPVDFNYLEHKQRERIRMGMPTPSERFEKVVSHFIGFNPLGEPGLKTMSKVKRIYLKHTPPDFIENLKELMRLETVPITLRNESDVSETFEVDLLSKEDRAKRNLKMACASRWNPSKWAAAPQEMKTTTPEKTEASFEIKSKPS